MGIGCKIRSLRERAGLTQGELAEKIGVTPSAVGNYEREVSHPREEVMYRLFGALHCEPNELFEDYFDEDAGASLGNRRLKKLIGTFCGLDSSGKKAVEAAAAREAERMAELTANENDEYITIAARKNGEPHKTRLKKRGSKSILDEPDYKGGKR